MTSPAIPVASLLLLALSGFHVQAYMKPDAKCSKEIKRCTETSVVPYLLQESSSNYTCQVLDGYFECLHLIKCPKYDARKSDMFKYLLQFLMKSGYGCDVVDIETENLNMEQRLNAAGNRLVLDIALRVFQLLESHGCQDVPAECASYISQARSHNIDDILCRFVNCTFALCLPIAEGKTVEKLFNDGDPALLAKCGRVARKPSSKKEAASRTRQDSRTLIITIPERQGAESKSGVERRAGAGADRRLQAVLGTALCLLLSGGPLAT